MKKVIAALLLTGCICFMLAACGSENTEGKEDEAMLKDCALIHDNGTSGVNLDISIDDFNALGFEYGDSVDVEFSNGYSLEDLPYYNGYYVAAYEPLLVAYPGASHVKATINYGDDLWTAAGLQKGDTASVSMHEKAKYLDIQEADDIQYSDNREDFPSDEVFSNFRNVTVGNIKENTLYRSASPCDNRHNRAACTDDLVEAAGIGCIVDLADNDEDIDGYMDAEDYDSPYFRSLYQSGDALPLDMTMNYESEEFRKTLTDGLTAMTEKEGPYLVHCTEGKDRTGFVCLLLGALCGASYDELVDDYMLTYDNYYGITKKSDPERYDTIKEQNFDVMLDEIISDDNVDAAKADLSGYARDYLVRIGMSGETADKLKETMEK